MTRKCIMCKGKNYKNACSFFSAPKDPETRRLWQQVINIKDYIVNDDTYVCSKHFNKDDIITHWVSGVPPQVITIKYKKCRLRRGAVPIPDGIKNNLNSNDPLNIENNDIILDDEKDVLESRQKKIDSNNKSINSDEVVIDSLNCNLEDEIYEYIPEDSQEPEEIESSIVISKNSKRPKMSNKNELDKHKAIYSTNHKDEILYIQCSDVLNDTGLQKSNSNIDSPQNVVKYLPKKTYGKAPDKDSNKSLQTKVVQETDQIVNTPINWNIEPINENLGVSENIEIDELGKESKKDNIVYKSKSLKAITDSNNLMLFEDFLEIFNETSLPSSWFASMVSKEDVTTIVYSCMNISNAGMPYVEKKVFLNNEMIIRCAVLNKEIDVTDNLNNKKNLHVYTLSDVEEFIEEFDQTPICSGLNSDCVYTKNSTKVLFDGVCWRHNECYMILSKGQSICVKCSTLMITKRL